MTNFIPVFILSELIILPNQEIKIDLSNELSKKIIKLACKEYDSEVLVIAPKNTLEISPSIEDLPKVGVIAKVKSKLELSNGKLRIVLRGIKRVRNGKYYQNKTTGILKCDTEVIELPNFSDAKEEAVRRKLITLTEEYIEMNNDVSNSILTSVKESIDLNNLTDMITAFIPFSFAKKLGYMECINPLTRATNLINDIQEEINISHIDKELNERLQDNLENSQREYILKEKLKEINNELGNNKDIEITKLNEMVLSLEVDDKIKEKLLNEIKKYSFSSDYSPESAVLKNYIDTVINLPWNESSKENLDVKKISSMLNERHFGLIEVKERILEYIMVSKQNKNIKCPIICLVGPPGVGKTSITMSIAKALNREFYKISVGGLNDSTELIGSRKTYLGAAPGKIMQGIIKCKVNNPLILIDEVDKMVKDYKGDPASTLLEILDESQNKYFTDNYIEEPFDLSRVMFILTANDEASIPTTLLDRLEIIHLESYSLFEKVDIAKNYLLKEILDNHQSSLKVGKEALEYIILNYTSESGVRHLKRCLEKLVRKVVCYEKEAKMLTTSLVDKYLTNKNDNYLPNIRDYGITNTVAYTTAGGLLSHVEVAKYKGSGQIIITGSCGEVLKESISVITSYLVSEYDIDIKNSDVHFHFITASQKKDGPSAGLATAVSLVSLCNKRLVDQSLAFTGEMSLKGNILPVGRVKEKIITASLHGIKEIFIPRANLNDIADIPMDVLNNITITPVSSFSEIYDVLFR